MGRRIPRLARSRATSWSTSIGPKAVANTDLDAQLKLHGIRKIILVEWSPTPAWNPRPASEWNWATT